MRVRRVVTGHTTGGRSTVGSDTVVNSVEAALSPGFTVNTLWARDEGAVVPDGGEPVEGRTFFPSRDGVRFISFTMPPAGQTRAPEVDIKAAFAEFDAAFPGLSATMDRSDPGMHRSDTVDFLVVVKGSVVLQLQDGVEVSLAAGDTIVQTGTWHRWVNRGSEPCQIVAVLLGAVRGGPL